MQLADEIGTAVLIDRDVIDVGHRDPGLAQTECDRLRGKAGPVLDAAEALLFRGRDQFAVTNERRRRIAMETVETENDHGKIRKNLDDGARRKRRSISSSAIMHSASARCSV